MFQNEVENQFNKRIKALRLDRGGEYLTYEYDDHLKSCGIVSQLTPLCSLLDMVRKEKSYLIRYGSIDVVSG